MREVSDITRRGQVVDSVKLLGCDRCSLGVLCRHQVLEQLVLLSDDLVLSLHCRAKLCVLVLKLLHGDVGVQMLIPVELVDELLASESEPCC